MLVKEGAALCSECHDDLANGTSVHAPVKDGKCTGCHNPHGSANRKLLVAAGNRALREVPRGEHRVQAQGRPRPRSTTAAAATSPTPPGTSACSPRTSSSTASPSSTRRAPSSASTATTSRPSRRRRARTPASAWGRRTCTPCTSWAARERTSKYGIVKKKDGQTCFACHLPHTSDQGKLLRTEYQCTGTFCYTMRFVQTEQGGTCIVGCHKPHTYSRDGQNPSRHRGTAEATPRRPPQAPRLTRSSSDSPRLANRRRRHAALERPPPTADEHAPEPRLVPPDRGLDAEPDAGPLPLQGGLPARLRPPAGDARPRRGHVHHRHHVPRRPAGPPPLHARADRAPLRPALEARRPQRRDPPSASSSSTATTTARRCAAARSWT